jgi:hypothetical protein
MSVTRIRLGWNALAGEDTLAYYYRALMMERDKLECLPVASILSQVHYLSLFPVAYFMVKHLKDAPLWGLYYKTFYDRNFRNKLECLSLARLSSLV